MQRSYTPTSATDGGPTSSSRLEAARSTAFPMGEMYFGRLRWGRYL